MLFLSRRRVSDARRFLTFRFPFSVDWIRRREREREREKRPKRTDVLVCPGRSGAFDSCRNRG